MSDSPLSPVGLNIVGLNVNEHTAAQAAAFLNETSTTSSSDETPSMDANYNSHDSANAAVTLHYPPALQVPVKQPTISSTSSESEAEGDPMTDSVENADHVASGSSNINTNNLSTGRSISPPPNCAICLGRCKNKCYTDSCMHQFCFKCLCEWSKVKPECPLCKQTFSSIIHNVKSDNQFEEYHVQPPTVQIPQRPYERLPVPYIVDVVNGHNIRSTDWNPWRITGAEVLESYRRMYTSRVPQGDEASGGSVTAPASSNLATHAEFIRMFPEGISLGNHTHMWRRYVYERKLYALPVCDITGRFRESSARFYRENPAQIYRLMPWINREVLCLLRNTEHDPSAVLTLINDALIVMNILSPSFRRRLQPFFGGKTAHFIHELNNFARSPFDMIGYDRNVQYSRQMSEEIVLDFSSSGSSDDDNNLRALSDRHQTNRGSTGTEQRLTSGLISTSEPQQPIVNLLAFTISTTSEGNEATGVTSVANGSRESQSIAMNLTTHNRTNSEVINLDDVEVVTESEIQTSGVDDSDRTATRVSINPSIAPSTSLTESTATLPMENIELNTSSSSDECQFVLERKPPHLRTPEMVSLNSDSDSDVIFIDELKLQSKSIQTPLLEQNSFSTSDDENDISRNNTIAYYTPPSNGIKYETNTDKFVTGASTSRGLRATGRRHSDVPDPDPTPSTIKRRTQRLRHRGKRSTPHCKSMRHRTVPKSSNSESDDSSSSSDMDVSPNKIEDPFKETKRKAKSNGKRKGTLSLKDSTRVSGPPAKRTRRKSKKTCKATKVNTNIHECRNSPDSSESVSELYNASESCTDKEEDEVLEDVRKRLRKQKTQAILNPIEYVGEKTANYKSHNGVGVSGTRNVNLLTCPSNERQEAGQEDADITNRYHSLNVTNPIRKMQCSLRTSNQGVEEITSEAVDQSQAAMSSSSRNNEHICDASRPSLSSSPPFQNVDASLYSADGNAFRDYERFLDTGFQPTHNRSHNRDDSRNIVDTSDEITKVHITSNQNSDKQFSINFPDDAPSTSQRAAKATTSSLSGSCNARKFISHIERADLSVFRDAAQSINETGETLLKDKQSTWAIADTNSQEQMTYVGAKIFTSICEDRRTEERECTVDIALRGTMESLQEVANESLTKSEPDDNDGHSDNNTDTDNSNDTAEEVQGECHYGHSDDVVVDSYDDESKSSTSSDFM